MNTFADATDDHQWIHVDPERAKEGPFGAPIAHGFLTLSLLIPMWSELFDVTGVRTKVNYGLDKVRFTSPVKVGSRIRMTVTITDVAGGQGQRPAPGGRRHDRDRGRGAARRGRHLPQPLLRLSAPPPDPRRPG